MSTKIRNYLLMLIPLFSAGRVQSQQQNGFEITGYINGLQEGEKVTLMMAGGAGTLSSIGEEAVKGDSAYVKDGVFHITGYVPDGPRKYSVEFEPTSEKFSLHRNRKFFLAINNGEKITIRCKKDITHIYDHATINIDLEITGAKYWESYEKLEPLFHNYDYCLKDFNFQAQKIKDSIGFDPCLLSGIFKSLEETNMWFSRFFFSEQPFQLDPSTTAAHLMYTDAINIVSKHASFMADRYKRLNQKEKESFYGKRLQQYAALCVGSPMPGFSFPDSGGKLVELKDIVSAGKLTLVNFWAVTAGFTPQSHDELKLFYNKYLKKGLNIVAVSSDDDESVWKNYIKSEKDSWTNLIDKGGAVVDTVYHELSMHPQKLRNVTNVLLDTQGNIVAWDVAGVELQWYLWKYLEAEK